jgi:hypothetical protein
VRSEVGHPGGAHEPVDQLHQIRAGAFEVLGDLPRLLVAASRSASRATVVAAGCSGSWPESHDSMRSSSQRSCAWWRACRTTPSSTALVLRPLQQVDGPVGLDQLQPPLDDIAGRCRASASGTSVIGVPPCRSNQAVEPPPAISPCQRNLESPLALLKPAARPRQRQILIDEPVEPVALPIQLLLQRHHRPAAEPLRQKPLERFADVGACLSATLPGASRERRACSSSWRAARSVPRRIGKLLQLCRIELVPVFPRQIVTGLLRPGAPLVSGTPASSRSKQSSCSAARAARDAPPPTCPRQLDHRRRTVEDLPTSIEHEVVVRCHEREHE